MCWCLHLMIQTATRIWPMMMLRQYQKKVTKITQPFHMLKSCSKWSSENCTFANSLRGRGDWAIGINLNFATIYKTNSLCNNRKIAGLPASCLVCLVTNQEESSIFFDHLNWRLDVWVSTLQTDFLTPRYKQIKNS